MAACESSASPQRAPRARASEDAVNNILNDAAAALARGDFGDACVKYRLVLSVDENNLAARLGLGEGALGEGNVNAASSHFTAAATAAPDNAAAQQGLGLAKLLGGDFTGAEPHLRRIWFGQGRERALTRLGAPRPRLRLLARALRAEARYRVSRRLSEPPSWLRHLERAQNRWGELSASPR